MQLTPPTLSPVQQITTMKTRTTLFIRTAKLTTATTKTRTTTAYNAINNTSRRQKKDNYNNNNYNGKKIYVNLDTTSCDYKENPNVDSATTKICTTTTMKLIKTTKITSTATSRTENSTTQKNENLKIHNKMQQNE